MQLLGMVLQELAVVLAIVTTLAFCWRCIRGFESTDTQVNLERIALALEKIAKARVEG